MSKVTSLNAERAAREHDNTLWSPVECLQSLLAEIQNGKVQIDRLLVLRVDNGDGDRFELGYDAANVQASHCLAMLEVAKAVILQQMGYIPKED